MNRIKKIKDFVFLTKWQPAIFFAVFVFWLTSFPMSEIVVGDSLVIAWFTLAHGCSLLVLAFWQPTVRYDVQFILGVLFCSLLTIFFTFVDYKIVLLVCLGVTAAPLSLSCGILLKNTNQVIWSAAFGLVIGNLLSVILFTFVLTQYTRLIILGMSLCSLVYGARYIKFDWQSFTKPRFSRGHLHYIKYQKLYSYLPFIFFFQVVSGIMYEKLWVSYTSYTKTYGFELLFYIGGVLIVVPLIKKTTRLVLLLCISTALIAFSSCYIFPVIIGSHIGLFSMMIATAMMDMFILVTVLHFNNQVFAYGLGVGLMVCGISAGSLFSRYMTNSLDNISLIALIILNIAVISMLILNKQKTKQYKSNLSLSDNAVLKMEETPAIVKQIDIPESITSQLSTQENRVLEKVMLQRTYREIADDLSIAESSVKTYMQRIYRKLGITRRKQLKRFIMGTYHQINLNGESVDNIDNDSGSPRYTNNKLAVGNKKHTSELNEK